MEFVSTSSGCGRYHRFIILWLCDYFCNLIGSILLGWAKFVYINHGSISHHLVQVGYGKWHCLIVAPLLVTNRDKKKQLMKNKRLSTFFPLILVLLELISLIRNWSVYSLQSTGRKKENLKKKEENTKLTTTTTKNSHKVNLFQKFTPLI